MKTQCSKSWTDVNIDFKNKLLRHCCKAEPYAFPDKFDIDFFDNSPQIQQRRQDTINGIQHPDCNACWAESNKGNGTYRDWWNKWSDDEFAKIDVHTPKVHNIEIELDSTCDQSCLYCFSICSSKIAQEEGVTHVDRTRNQDISIFKKWIEDLATRDTDKQLAITFTGGEPTASKLFYELIDFIVEVVSKNPMFDVCIDLCTNGNSKKHLMDKLIRVMDSGIASWAISISNESYGEDAELVRYGLDWDRFKNNLRRYMRHPMVSCITFAVTVNALNLPSFARYIRFVQSTIIKHAPDQEYKWVGSFVTSPWELDIKYAPVQYKKYLIDAKKQYASTLIGTKNISDRFVTFLTQMEERISTEYWSGWEEEITEFLENKNSVKQTDKLNKLINDIKAFNNGS